MNSPDKPLQMRIEKQETYKPSKIELHFFRHSIKESFGVSGAGATVPLSPVGRELAKANAFENVNLGQAVAFGSPRIRTQETAGFMLSGGLDNITGEETLDELKDKLNADILVGSKIGVDNRLDFTDIEETPVGESNYNASRENVYTKHLVENSDRIAKESGDISGADYSSKASDIAKIIEKYIKISPRWHELSNDKSKNYTDKLERYFCSHQGVLESFLAKVIEKDDGIEARDAFVNMAGHQGFDYTEGYTVIIENQNNSPKIFVEYKTEKGEIKKEITPEIIRNIIEG